MKSLSQLFLLAVLVHSGFAQGSVSMNTFFGTTRARCTYDFSGTQVNANGTAITSNGHPCGLGETAGTWKVGLYAGPAGTPEGSLALVGPLATFGSSQGTAGYVLTSTGGGNRIVPGVPGGSYAALQIRAWTGAYSTYEEALSGSTFFVTKSGIVIATLGTPPTGQPALLTGLAPFTVGIPEPSPAMILSSLTTAFFVISLLRKRVKS